MVKVERIVSIPHRYDQNPTLTFESVFVDECGFQFLIGTIKTGMGAKASRDARSNVSIPHRYDQNHCR